MALMGSGLNTLSRPRLLAWSESGRASRTESAAVNFTVSPAALSTGERRRLALMSREPLSGISIVLAGLSGLVGVTFLTGRFTVGLPAGV